MLYIKMEQSLFIKKWASRVSSGDLSALVVLGGPVTVLLTLIISGM
ncbi:hypothetical protein JHX96_00405 [Staphylococcus saccharolyticus]|nr:hypothetical protein [Staphylococcus saccharolyticus]MBL7584806.1 hypothetical protein [Staphylococcus saccharolyticus]MBL7638229.1 hypothetical protein [Staphylococcus saccharolyticus]